MLLLDNTIQNYAWGTRNGMAPLVGTTPSGQPEAELWVGTHPIAPSRVVGDPLGRSLADVIAEDPHRWLGPELADRGHRALPFLLKVLAVGEPLSIQAHPSEAQARRGFAREEEAGIPIDAANRTYRDPNAKPEALVALTDTWALCGFRNPDHAADLVDALGVADLAPLVNILRGRANDALAEAMAWLLGLEGDRRAAVAAATVQAAASLTAAGRNLDGGDEQDWFDPRSWVVELGRFHPGDPGCVAPLLCEVVHLEPDDAVHLPAGNLHAYLRGAGVELMSASDNVLRGGLTVKHIDVAELLEVVRFEPGVPDRPRRSNPRAGLTTWDCGEPTFSLAAVDPSPGGTTIATEGPALLLSTAGPVTVAGAERRLELSAGRAVFVPPDHGDLVVSGPGRLWWATVGTAAPR